MEIEENVIVGGGPSGAYCAFELARKGIYPTVFDHSHPREKPCGGGIEQIVVEKFPFVQDFKPRVTRSTDFRIISCLGTQITKMGVRRGFSVSRRLFDQSLLMKATEKGAVHVKERVIKIRRKRFWKIKTNKRILLAKNLIGADGVNSIARNNRYIRHEIEQHYRKSVPRRTKGAFSPENLALTYGYFATGIEKEPLTIKYLEFPGFIWIIPRDDHSSIGIGSQLNNGKKLKPTLNEFILSRYPEIKIISKPFAHMLPSIEPSFLDLPSSGENWILVGDAAGHVNPITGAGILYALWSAELAADAIHNKDLKSYDKTWRKEYGAELKKLSEKKKEFYAPLRIEAILFKLSNNANSELHV